MHTLKKNLVEDNFLFKRGMFNAAKKLGFRNKINCGPTSIELRIILVVEVWPENERHAYRIFSPENEMSKHTDL